MERCYKVFRVGTDGKLMSLLGNRTHNWDFWKCNYTPFVRTVAPLGKLFVFSDPECAKRFIHLMNPNFQIWVGYTTANLSSNAYVALDSFPDNLKDYWESRWRDLVMCPPYDTWFADDFIPCRRIA